MHTHFCHAAFILSFMFTLGELRATTSNRKAAAYSKRKPFTSCFSTNENSPRFSDDFGDTRVARCSYG